MISINAFAAPKFKDVSSNQWFYKYVNGIVEKGIMSGTSSNTFSPNDTVTRAQVTQTMYAMAGKPSVKASDSFKDVPEGKYYTTAVNWGVDKGVVAGYVNGEFKPNAPITRQQFATVLYSFARKVETGNKFTDYSDDLSFYDDKNNVSSYAIPAVRWAVKLGIINSTEKNRFIISPNGVLTRAQLATMLLAYINCPLIKPYLDSAETGYDVNYVKTPYYRVVIPYDLSDTFVCVQGDGEVPTLSFYDENIFKSRMMGHVFTIMLFPDNISYEEQQYPQYEVFGRITNGSKAYTVILLYPSDVQYPLEYLDEYTELTNWVHEIFPIAIAGINGYKLDRY